MNVRKPLNIGDMARDAITSSGDSGKGYRDISDILLQLRAIIHLCMICVCYDPKLSSN